MLSRRLILSRSRDDLNLPEAPQEEDDIWFSKDKLLKDHIQEVLDKWEQINDDTWAKVIVFERNYRVAKAYARAPVLTVNGSEDEFDGFRIGLNGFENPMRDAKTGDILRHVGHGIKIKMDDGGNIFIKRLSKNSVFVRATAEENAISNDVSKLPGGAIELGKPMLLFDMKKFTSNVSRELRRAYPDRRKLEIECVTAVSFVKQESELLSCPSWILIINLVALDILKARIPPLKQPQNSQISQNLQQSNGNSNVNGFPQPLTASTPISLNSSTNGVTNNGNGNGFLGTNFVPPVGGVQLPAPIPVTNNGNGITNGGPKNNAMNGSSGGNGTGGILSSSNNQDIRNRPRIPIPNEKDEDPYAALGRNKNQRVDQPPKLPPRDLNIPKPDYDDSLVEEEPLIKPFFNSSRTSAKEKQQQQGKDRKYDDPYYCGLRARIPAFVQKAIPIRKSKNPSAVPPANSQNLQNGLLSNGHMPNGHMPNGHLQNGLMPNGHLQNGHMSNGALPPPPPSTTSNGTSNMSTNGVNGHSLAPGHYGQIVNGVALNAIQMLHHLPHPHHRFTTSTPISQQPTMWHAKSVDSGMASIHSNPYAEPLSIRKMNGGSDKYSWNHAFESESDLVESIYAPLYGRLPLPMRNPNTFSPHARLAYVGDWE